MAFAVPLIMLIPTKAVSVKQVSNALKKQRSPQLGINMVDLMMWIAIITLLIATALQGITYYQKNAYIFQMKNDLTHASEVISAKAALNDGRFSVQAVSDGSHDTNKTGEVALLPDPGASDAVGYVLRGTHPGVADLDVVYLSKQRGGYAPGIHVVLKGTLIAPDGATTIDPGTEDGGTGTTPTTDTSSIMTTVWDTRLTYKNSVGAEVSCTSLIVPLTGSVNAVIDWGDGEASETVTSIQPTHDYVDTPGLKTVTITGTFTGWVGENEDYWSDNCLIKVTSWGDGTNTSDVMSGFKSATSLTDVARLPKTVIDKTAFLFYRAKAFTGESVSSWDVSGITSMEYMFAGTEAFQGDISKWDVSNVTDMSGLLAESSFNGDISDWDVSNVTDINYMFAKNTAFNGDISNWDVTSVEHMGLTFYLSSFNGDISNWKTYSLTNVVGMFQDNASFDVDIGGWDTSKVTNMQQMFLRATAFNRDLTSWDVSSVTIHKFFADGSGMTPDHLPTFPSP